MVDLCPNYGFLSHNFFYLDWIIDFVTVTECDHFDFLSHNYDFSP